ncbi:hypothetical protein A4E84_31360 [Streptomyces qaidamensis]|uniref:Uncharacterized protein n=1 Tax=Streptomyces qaidamensis TaxID=1783515 RepID=A0A143C870_9ACTN|nr:hypothetical protein [Streptomyces qaidamensis]AMW13611.1 hypothetical protein A4E84_31360 [Streptomyces qaidamensis]
MIGNVGERRSPLVPAPIRTRRLAGRWESGPRQPAAPGVTVLSIGVGTFYDGSDLEEPGFVPARMSGQEEAFDRLELARVFPGVEELPEISLAPDRPHGVRDYLSHRTVAATVTAGMRRE